MLCHLASIKFLCCHQHKTHTQVGCMHKMHLHASAPQFTSNSSMSSNQGFIFKRSSAQRAASCTSAPPELSPGPAEDSEAAAGPLRNLPPGPRTLLTACLCLDSCRYCCNRTMTSLQRQLMPITYSIWTFGGEWSCHFWVFLTAKRVAMHLLFLS